jgi:large subunit ribosomal protein L24
MSKMRLRKNDIVYITKGKDKGKTGKVLKVIPEKDQVIVERINFHKEFVRADRSKQQQGGILDKEAPIHSSNLMLYCSDCSRPVRVKTKVLDDRTRIRICARCDSQIEKQK